MTRAGWAYLARQKSSAFTVKPDLLLAALSVQLKQQPVPEHCSV
jgi:hypothetical protein